MDCTLAIRRIVTKLVIDRIVACDLKVIPILWQKQIGAGFRLTEICGVIVPLTKLEKERHLSESASSALFDMMDMFVETLLASGEVLRSGPQEITSLLDSLRRTSYRPNPAFVFTLNRC